MIIADNHITNCEIKAPVEIFQEHHQSCFIFTANFRAPFLLKFRSTKMKVSLREKHLSKKS